MYFSKGFEVEFKPKCEECYLKAVNGVPRSYYEIVFPKSVLRKQIQLRVVGYIKEE